MNESANKLKNDNTLLRAQLERSEAENIRLRKLLSESTSSGLSNNDLHRFNNVAALLDANIELALNALRNLHCYEGKTDQPGITTVHSFIDAVQNAKTELVDIANS